MLLFYPLPRVNNPLRRKRVSNAVGKVSIEFKELQCNKVTRCKSSISCQVHLSRISHFIPLFTEITSCVLCVFLQKKCPLTCGACLRRSGKKNISENRFKSISIYTMLLSSLFPVDGIDINRSSELTNLRSANLNLSHLFSYHIFITEEVNKNEFLWKLLIKYHVNIRRSGKPADWLGEIFALL